MPKETPHIASIAMIPRSLDISRIGHNEKIAPKRTHERKRCSLFIFLEIVAPNSIDAATAT